MRSLLGLVLATGVPISIGYVVACGPPSSFDHITGGEKDGGAEDVEASAPLVEDPSLPKPRPTAPLSGSWINGSRPRFRWQLPDSGGTGARISICPDRACKSTIQQWDATGSETQAPEDLPPGRYFWRLVSTNASSFGRETSPTWMMLVRGGAGDGVPGGAVNDQNGDGISDLFVAVDFNAGDALVHDVMLFLGSSLTDPLALVTGADQSALMPRDYAIGVSDKMVLQAVDLDGDGLSDLAIADQEYGSPNRAAIGAFRGAKDAVDFRDLGRPAIPGLDAIPQIAAPGDLDGDGFGDILVGSKAFSLVVFGAEDGLTQLSLLTQIPATPDVDAGDLPGPTAPMPIGGADLDNDGRIDVTIPMYFANAGLGVAQSQDDRTIFPPAIAVRPDAGAVSPATAFGFGDMDADGKLDIVFVTTRGDTKPAVCVLTDASDGQPICWTPDAAPAGFASSLVGADLDGDGKDEILVGSTSGGVDVLRLPTPEKIEVEHLAIEYGATMTVLDPGRPKAAVWAATRADGTSVALFQGKEQKRVLTLKDAEFDQGYPAVRYQPGIR